MHRLLLALTLGATLATTAPAQTAATPDLSGTWKLNLAKSKLPKNSPTQPYTLTITTEGSKIQFRYSADPKDKVVTYIAIADGKDHSEFEGTPNARVKAKWNKSVLVIDSVIGLSNGFEIMHVTRRWSLSSDARTLTEESDAKTKELHVYDKQ
jgi:hypothetical protein